MWRAQLFGMAMCVFGAIGASSCAADPASCPNDVAHAAVITAEGEQCFRVKIADTAEKWQMGLMFVRDLEDDRGMLFVFDWVGEQSFWMKNTYISLDIIFIAPDGRIVNIAERTEPLSEETIPSAAPISAVLEINGGLARKLGIEVGDLVRHPALGRPEAGQGVR